MHSIYDHTKLMQVCVNITCRGKPKKLKFVVVVVVFGDDFSVLIEVFYPTSAWDRKRRLILILLVRIYDLTFDSEPRNFPTAARVKKKKNH